MEGCEGVPYKYRCMNFNQDRGKTLGHSTKGVVPSLTNTRWVDILCNTIKEAEGPYKPMPLLNETLLSTLNSKELWTIVILSLQVSLSAVLIGSLFALPIGALIAVSRFPGRQSLIIVLNSLMGTPTVIIGVLVYLLLSRSGPLGQFGLLFTPKAMVLAQTILVLPIIAAWTRQTIADALEQYKDLFHSLTINPIRQAMLLLADTRFSLLIIILAACGRALSEVGAVMIVGGNILNVTRVMTTSIALETSKGDLTLALALGIVLMSVIVLINITAGALKWYVQSYGAGKRA